MSFMSRKTSKKSREQEFRTRNQPSDPQYGQHFPVQPHGNKADLPRGLRQVSFSPLMGEIPEFFEKRRRKRMTPEEIAEDELIENAIDEQIAEEAEMVKKKNLLTQLGEALDRSQKKNRLKKSLAEAKAEQETHEGEDGYEDYEQRLAQIQHKNDENEVFG